MISFEPFLNHLSLNHLPVLHMLPSRSIVTIVSITTLHLQSESQSNSTDSLIQCTLQWRQQQLWVKRSTQVQALELPALQSRDWMTACLKQSSVKLVVLDASLESEAIQFWSELCRDAHKRVIVRVRSVCKASQKGNRFLFWLKQIPDRLITMMVFAVLSPFILGIILVISSKSRFSLPQAQKEWSSTRQALI